MSMTNDAMMQALSAYLGTPVDRVTLSTTAGKAFEAAWRAALADPSLERVERENEECEEIQGGAHALRADASWRRSPARVEQVGENEREDWAERMAAGLERALRCLTTVDGDHPAHSVGDVEMARATIKDCLAAFPAKPSLEDGER